MKNYLPFRPPTFFLLKRPLGQTGMSLIETMIVIGIMSIMTLVMLHIQQNQIKANTYVEFIQKKLQLEDAIFGQVLDTPDNCACLFAGANAFPANPAAPGATLAGVAPTQIGRYSFVNPGDCATAIMPQPMVDNVGIDGIQATLIQIRNILFTGGSYAGELVVNLRSTREVLGPQDVQIKMPVTVMTSPAGANVNFVSCSRPDVATALVKNCHSIDPARPWIKNSIICRKIGNSGSYLNGDLIQITLSHISGNTVAYRHGGYNDDIPMGVRYNATTGAYISSGNNNDLENGGLDCTDAASNLQNLANNLANTDGC